MTIGKTASSSVAASNSSSGWEFRRSNEAAADAGKSLFFGSRMNSVSPLAIAYTSAERLISIPQK
jgi:hypothetical protein